MLGPWRVTGKYTRFVSTNHNVLGLAKGQECLLVQQRVQLDLWVLAEWTRQTRRELKPG